MKTTQNLRVINHKVLRRGTGIIAFLLPILVSIIVPGCPSSISITYHTDAHDVFVGGLIAVAFFLAAYNGNGSCQKDLEYYYSKAASLFAALVALVPTSPKLRYEDSTPYYIRQLFGCYHGTVHNVAAVLLFIVLILMVAHFARRAQYKERYKRSMIYKVILTLMIAGMATIAIIGLTTSCWTDWVYWLELVGLWLFGIAWIIAGSYRTTSSMPRGATHIGAMKVYAAQKDNFLHVKLKDDTTYYFKASGCWKDAGLATTATGWGPRWRFITKKTRYEGHPIFFLCASRGGNIERFPVGNHTLWKSPKNLSQLPEPQQQLSFWANDFKNRYGNNSGYLQLDIYEV